MKFEKLCRSVESANTLQPEGNFSADSAVVGVFPSFYSAEMIQQKTLYLFLAKRTIWYWSAGKQSCLKPVSKPLGALQIIELCRKLSFSKVVLFLEFPWVLTNFEITIPLAQDEFASYARTRLGFAKNKKVEGKNSLPEKQSHPVHSVNQLGGIYFKQSQADRVGLLCAALSKESVHLKKLLTQEFGTKVELVPLAALCFPLLLKMQENTIIFKGLEQSFFLQKTNNFPAKFIELPDFEIFSPENFVADQIPLNNKDQAVQVYLEQSATKPAENKTLAKNEQLEAKSHNSISMQAVLSEWKGPARSPQTGFWWESSNKLRRAHKVKLWKNLVAVLLLTGVAAAVLFYYQLQQQKIILQQKLSNLETELENQIKTIPSKLRSERKKHLEQLEKLAKQLVRNSFWTHQTLQVAFNSIEGAWLENFDFKGQQLRLELLTMEPINAVELFLKFSKMSEFVSVQFKSQQKIKLKEHDLMHFVLELELAPSANPGN